LRVNGEECNSEIKVSFDRFLLKQNLVRKILENDTEKRGKEIKREVAKRRLFILFYAPCIVI
jgi:hypothetical protein